MKKTLFTALAVGILVASCSKDNNEAGITGPGKQASLNISVSSPDMSRATGAAPGGDNTVNNFSVFVIDDAGNIAWETHAGSGTTASLQVTTSAKKVYVIANAGDKTSVYTNEAQLLAAKEDLGSQFTNRWATGVVSIAASDWVTSGQTTSVTKAITLDFIAARIRLTVLNNMLNYDGSDPSTVILNSVAVLNARGQSKLFATAPATTLIPSAYDANKKFLTGTDMSGMGNSPTASEFTLDAATLSDAYTSAGGGDSKTYHYYVYENDAVTAAALPTIVTLIGTNAAAAPVYFPVHLAPYETFTNGSSTIADGIKRGHSYDITMNLKGDAKDGNGGGGTDPTVPQTEASVDITIQIKDWTPVTLGKDFE